MTVLNCTPIASTSARPGVRSGVAVRFAGNAYEARVAMDRDTKRDAFALRYNSYLDSGFIGPNDSGLFHDEFDRKPNARTIVVYDSGEAVASVRACFLSVGDGSTSPALETYPNEVRQVLTEAGQGRMGIAGLEVNRLVRSPQAANNQGLVFLLYRLVGRLALTRDFRVVVSCVRRNHVPFYRRLRFQECGGSRQYPGLNCPMHLVSCSRADYDENRSVVAIMDPDAAAGVPAELETGRSVHIPLLPIER